MALSKKQREYSGKCTYCGTDLQKGWHADHMKPLHRLCEFKVVDGKLTSIDVGKSKNPQNDTFENMTPSCPSCNIYKSTSTIEDFRKRIAARIKSLRENSTCFKFAERYNQVEVTDEPVAFWFEQIIINESK